MKQGQGHYTARKENGFALVIRQNLLMTKKWLDRDYFHFDANCGSGFNEKADCPGSPIIFLNEAEQVGRPFHAVFCDSDPEAATALQDGLAFEIGRFDSSSLKVVCKDNGIALMEFADLICEQDNNPKNACGMVLCDPNGAKGLPLPELKVFAQRFRKIDMVINVNISLWKRMEEWSKKKDGRFDKYGKLADIPGTLIPKDYWMVRNPPPGGKGERFIILVGRNTPNGMMRAFGEFYPIDSPEGHLIIGNLERVVPEQRYLDF